MQERVSDSAPIPPRATTRREADRVWRALFRRQLARLPGRMCAAFLDGFRAAALEPDRLPRHADLSRRLADRCGWRIETVPGLIPVRDFFALLRERRFPSPVWIRGASSLGYTPEPDAFHDLFGHVPQLAEPRFAGLLESLAARAEGAGERELAELERVYWFTIEFGLVRDDGAGVRAMGAGLASSLLELDRALVSREVRRLPFELVDARTRGFETDRPQETYLVAPSLGELARSLAEDWAPWQPGAGAGTLSRLDRRWSSAP